MSLFRRKHFSIFSAKVSVRFGIHLCFGVSAETQNLRFGRALSISTAFRNGIKNCMSRSNKMKRPICFIRPILCEWRPVSYCVLGDIYWDFGIYYSSIHILNIGLIMVHVRAILKMELVTLPKNVKPKVEQIQVHALRVTAFVALVSCNFLYLSINCVIISHYSHCKMWSSN